MSIIHVDKNLVAILIKDSIYIIDMDNFLLYDQAGNRLAIVSLDDWLWKNTLWAHGILNLKLFVNFYLQGRESVVIDDLEKLLASFVIDLFKSGHISEIMKLYDVEQLSLETIDKTVLPNLRDNFDKYRSLDGDLSLELFLRRLKDRLKILNPGETRVIDSFLSRLPETHVDIQMAMPESLLNHAIDFLRTHETYRPSLKYPNLLDTFDRIKILNKSKSGSEPVLSQ